MTTDLDQLLAAWAASQRLTPAAAERIRVASVEPAPQSAPTYLSARWWCDLTDRTNATIARAQSDQWWLPRAG